MGKGRLSTRGRVSIVGLSFLAAVSVLEWTPRAAASGAPVSAASAETAFFVTPYLANLKKVTGVLMEAFDDSQETAGFNATLQLSQGGFIPGGQQPAPHTGAWTNAGIVIDNSLQESKSLDYFSGYFGFTPTNVYATLRSTWLASSMVWTDDKGANPTTYNGLDRREIYFGKNTGSVYGTASQTMWATGHGPASAQPVVTALPTTPITSLEPRSMEEFGAMIILENLKGNEAQAASMMAGVFASQTSTGDLSAPYGGGVIRSLAFTIVAARATGLWVNYQPQLQKIIDLIWKNQDPASGGLPQTFGSKNFHTPEPNGQALLAFDPNLPSWFGQRVVQPGAGTIMKTSGDGQVGAVGTVLPIPLGVTLTDGSGSPVAGTNVSFAVTSGTGTLSAADAVTDKTGAASVTLTPEAAGAITVTASATGLTSVAFAETGTSGSKSGGGGPGLTWTPGRPFPTFAECTSLDVANMGGNADQQILLRTLQGLVNRTQPRIYLEPDAGGNFWIGKLDVPKNDVSNPLTLVTKYRSEIKGMVIYDPTVPDTINLATTMAGIEGGVVASPTLATTLAAAPYNLATLVDVRTLQLTSAVAVYQYELDNYASRASSQILTGVDPAESNGLRDYAVATRACVVWLDPTNSAELGLLDSFLSRLQPNAPYMGWWTQEQPGVSAASSYGHPTFAANLATNLTALAGVRAAITPQAIPPAPALENKVYVALFVSDGDNVVENQNDIPQKWQDPARGKVPITWTVQPALVDLAPAILSYFSSAATPNDALSSGPSGLGYTYPALWPAAALVDYTEASATYLGEAGLKMITVWNDAKPLAGTQAGIDYATNMPHLLGVTTQTGAGALAIEDGTLPVLAMAVPYGRTGADLQSGISTAIAGWSGTKPLFLTVQGDDNGPAITPTALLSVQQAFASNPDVVFVRGDHLFQLIRKANGLTTSP